MKIQFHKLQALGNDFVLIDLDQNDFNPQANIIKKLGNRHLGIGFDQLILIRKENNTLYHIRFFNSDGNEAFQCGNGLRAIGVYLKKLYNCTGNITLKTAKQNYNIQIQDQQIIADLGKPIFSPADIPFNTREEKNSYELKIADQTFQIGVVSVGNPHCVIKVDDVNKIDLETIGKIISTHPLFPQQANVEFIQIESQDRVRVRVYERGIGETQACGSGAAAVFAIGQRWKLLADRVEMVFPGGILQVYQQQEHIYLVGDAEYIYFGQMY